MKKLKSKKKKCIVNKIGSAYRVNKNSKKQKKRVGFYSSSLPKSIKWQMEEKYMVPKVERFIHKGGGEARDNLEPEESRLISNTIYEQDYMTCWAHAASKVIRPVLSKLKNIHLTDEQVVSEIIKIHKQFFNNKHEKYNKHTDDYKDNAVEKYLENIGLNCKFTHITSFDDAKLTLEKGYPLLIQDRSFGENESHHMVVGNAIDKDGNILYISSVDSNNNRESGEGKGKYSKEEFKKKIDSEQITLIIMEDCKDIETEKNKHNNAVEKYLKNIGLKCKFTHITSLKDARLALEKGSTLLIRDMSLTKPPSRRWQHIIVDNAIDKNDNIQYISSVGTGKYLKGEFFKNILLKKIIVYILEECEGIETETNIKKKLNANIERIKTIYKQSK